MALVQKVDTMAIAEGLRSSVRADVAASEVKPKLVGFLANKDPSAKLYAEWTGRAAMKDGIDYEIREMEPVELEAAIDEANNDESVHGILIYYPVFGAAPSFFGGSMDDQLRDRISIEKDVEGLTNFYRSALYRNVRFLGETKKTVVPCTALAVVKCLEYLKVYSNEKKLPLTGKICTVINRSEVVGRPLAAMLANDGATVYSVDVDSIYLVTKGQMALTDLTPFDAVKLSDVVVLGVPSKAYKLDANHLKDDAIVVNVSSFKNLQDTDTKKYTYVSQVGRVTVACLERSLTTLYKQYHSKSAKSQQNKKSPLAFIKDFLSEPSTSSSSGPPKKNSKQDQGDDEPIIKGLTFGLGPLTGIVLLAATTSLLLKRSK